MVKISVFLAALLVSSVAAFAPLPTGSRCRTTAVVSAVAPDVDSYGNNLEVKRLLNKAQETGLLSKVVRSGLLSKAQKAGVKLSSLEPLLEIVGDNPEVLVLVEASGPEVLKILPLVLDLAPAALPLLAAAVQTPPTLLYAAALASVGAAGGIVFLVPDDTIVNVALQTIGAATFGLLIPGISVVGATALGQLTK